MSGVAIYLEGGGDGRDTKAALRRARNLETVAKAAVVSALEQATRHIREGAYYKIRHASDLLKRIDREAAQRRCSGCARLRR